MELRLLLTPAQDHGREPCYDSAEDDRDRDSDKDNRPDHEADSETGLQYLRTRYYDPATGQFLTRDSLGLASGETNLCGYAARDPPTSSTRPGCFSGFLAPQAPPRRASSETRWQAQRRPPAARSRPRLRLAQRAHSWRGSTASRSRRSGLALAVL